MSLGDQVVEERRRRRRAGDPRITEEGREILRRITTGDVADELGRAMDEASDTDPTLSEDAGHVD